MEYAKSSELFSSQITIVCVCVCHLRWCIAFAIRHSQDKEWLKRTRPFVLNHISASVCCLDSSLLHSLYLYGFRGIFHRFIWTPNVCKTQTATESEGETMRRECVKEIKDLCDLSEMKLWSRQPHNSTSAKLIHRVTWMRRFIAIYTVVYRVVSLFMI